MIDIYAIHVIPVLAFPHHQNNLNETHCRSLQLVIGTPTAVRLYNLDWREQHYYNFRVIWLTKQDVRATSNEGGND